MDRIRLRRVLRHRRRGPSHSRARIRSAISIRERVCMELSRVADDKHILCTWSGLAHRRGGGAELLSTISEYASGIRPSRGRGRRYMRRWNIPGISASHVGSAIGLSSVIMAALLLSWTFRETPGWRALFPFALAIALGMLIAFLSMIADVGMPGLQQRIFLFLILVWISIVVTRLARAESPVA